MTINNKYTVVIEHKSGNKKATKNDAAYMEIHITTELNVDVVKWNENIITRCVVKFDGKNWVMVDTDGKFHKKNFTDYMSQECANEVFNKAWSMKKGNILEVQTNKVTDCQVELYKNDYEDHAETWEEADDAIISIDGVEEHSHDLAVARINNFVKQFVKENKGAVNDYYEPLQEEEYEKGIYSLSYTIYRKK